MTYKYCLVPHCSNTSIKTPEKLFLQLPKDEKRRKMWLTLARRDPNEIAATSCVYFCEDHFDLERDIENYNQYRLGFSKRLLLVKGVLPSKFYCQQDRRKRLGDCSTSRGAYIKRQRSSLIKECEEAAQSNSENVTATCIQSFDSEMQNTDELETTESYNAVTSENSPPAKKCVGLQINIQHHYRSKSVQTKPVILKKDVSLSPCKIPTTSTCTSPIKTTQSDLKLPTSNQRRKLEVSRCVIPKNDFNAMKKKVGLPEDENCGSDVCPFGTLSSDVSDSDYSASETNVDIEKMLSLQNTMRLILKKPFMYVGIPKECYFIVQLIQKHCNIPEKHILLCLKKIRLNSTFSELEDDFGISVSYGSKLFLKCVPLIASVLHPFIVKLDKNSIKKTLPIAFRHKYYNVSCTIDCLEIDIQKPSKALHQALTWSDYKKANTIKYLIACTPNGLVSYVSCGFGGRTTDVTIVENCNILDHLEPGTFVLADRGFKHVEQMLSQNRIKLLRPPSVAAGCKLSKEEVRQAKSIASLRIHIERVIRRIREFHMLKQHSVVNSNILRVLDDVVVIACALINLQDSLIK